MNECCAKSVFIARTWRKNMIPKVIHFCWFGGNGLPDSTKRYIGTWRKNLPDYRIIKWSEKNFDVSSAPAYVQEAYQAGKYAFVSDYVRIQALQKYGGIYFDTDVEVVKPINEYLEGRSMVLGFESDRSLTTAFIACEKGHPFIDEFEKKYHERKFIQEDGSMDLTPINVGFSAQAEEWGLDLSRNAFQEIGDGIAVYPIEYFAAFDVKNWHEKVTPNSCTIHHMDASWVEKKLSVHIVVIRGLQKALGYNRYDRLRGFVGRLKGGK